MIEAINLKRCGKCGRHNTRLTRVRWREDLGLMTCVRCAVELRARQAAAPPITGQSIEQWLAARQEETP